MKDESPKIIYYSDEENDEFAGDSLKPIPIDENYKYGDNSIGWRLAHYIWYRIIATPIAWLYMKLAFHHKIVNRKAIKEAKKSGFFIFANHTNPIADALIPTFVSFPKHVFVIVHANNVSIPVVGKITPYLGALPLPDNLQATRNFMNVLKLRVENKKTICIYPEAHIWPYYTKIRPFHDTSFRYPVQYNVPAFCFTNTYHKRRFSKTPKIITYVDGPFFADEGLAAKEAKTNLRNKIYNQMVERSKNNTFEMIKYLKKEEK